MTLREYRPGDEEGLIACIREEYGETYFKRDFYSPDYIRKEAESGHITFLVAQVMPDEIAGMLILKEFAPKESMCEIATQIIRKKYRGHGIAMPLFEYGMGILLNRIYSAAYSLPVLFHDTTQRLLYRLGLKATGFVLNVFDMENITHSYQNGRNTKHSQGIQIRAVNKSDAGNIYVPPKHKQFCEMVYARLGVNCRIQTLYFEELLPERSEFEYRQDSNQSSLEIHIHQVGRDIHERILEVQGKYPLVGRQTANVFLNISDDMAVWAYERLIELGYFFTGLKPLCSDREYMVLHNPGEVKTYTEDYVLSEEFQELLRQL